MSPDGSVSANGFRWGRRELKNAGDFGCLCCCSSEETSVAGGPAFGRRGNSGGESGHCKSWAIAGLLLRPLFFCEAALVQHRTVSEMQAGTHVDRGLSDDLAAYNG